MKEARCTGQLGRCRSAPTFAWALNWQIRSARSWRCQDGPHPSARRGCRRCRNRLMCGRVEGLQEGERALQLLVRSPPAPPLLCRHELDHLAQGRGGVGNGVGWGRGGGALGSGVECWRCGWRVLSLEPSGGQQGCRDPALLCRRRPNISARACTGPRGCNSREHPSDCAGPRAASATPAARHRARRRDSRGSGSPSCPPGGGTSQALLSSPTFGSACSQARLSRKARRVRRAMKSSGVSQYSWCTGGQTGGGACRQASTWGEGEGLRRGRARFKLQGAPARPQVAVEAAGARALEPGAAAPVLQALPRRDGPHTQAAGQQQERRPGARTQPCGRAGGQGGRERAQHAPAYTTSASRMG